jgi:cyclophilin family peptidyl-prolyl cis-trans isomerase
MTHRRWLPLALVLLLAACGGGGSKDSASETTTTAATSTPATTDGNGCSTVEQPKPAARKATKPAQGLDRSKAYSVTFKTNCGSFTIDLAVKTAPATTASFVSLARKGFYDNTIFHRIVPGFIIQGGDPTASGLGGPGYSTVDKPPPTARYTLGTVAMAKTQAEAPGTSGSQFFIVTAQDAQLPPEYAIIGEVKDGLDTVTRIGDLGDPATEQPTEVVEIQKATVSAE